MSATLSTFEVCEVTGPEGDHVMRPEGEVKLRITNIGSLPRVPLSDRGDVVALVDGDTGAQHVDVHINILHAGGPRGRYHYHPVSENIYIVLQGTGRFVAEGQEYPLKKDDIVFIPPGVKHSLSAHDDVPLMLVEIFSPIPVETVFS